MLFIPEMNDHLKYAHLCQLNQAMVVEPVQRLREAVIECGDEEGNRIFMMGYLREICRRMRLSRTTHGYVPCLEDGVGAAQADAEDLLKGLERHEDSSPVKLVALRRAAAGLWRQPGDEDQETNDLAVKLLQVEVARSLTLVVAAARETRREAGDDIWGTAAEEDEKVAAAAAAARVLEGESELVVSAITAHAFRP